MSTVISPGISEACIQFLAIDDTVVENCELFILMAEISNPNDIVNGTVSIIILDNDGKNDYAYTTL